MGLANNSLSRNANNDLFATLFSAQKILHNLEVEQQKLAVRFDELKARWMKAGSILPFLARSSAAKAHF